MERSIRYPRRYLVQEEKVHAHKRRLSAPTSIGLTSEAQERDSIELQVLTNTSLQQQDKEERHSKRLSRRRDSKTATESSKHHRYKQKLERRHSYSENSFVPLETIAESAEALRQTRMNSSDRELSATLARHARSISRELQTLLDAQSDGLTKALGGGPSMSTASSPKVSDSKSETQRPASSGSSRSESRELVFRDDPMASTHHLTASTTQLSKSRLYTTPRHVTPVRQPVKAKPPTLKQARKGISAKLGTLAGVKENEAHLFDRNAQDGIPAISNLENMRKKRSYLEMRMQEVETAALQDADDERQLQAEEHALEREISRLEARLEDLKVDLKFKRSERQGLRSEREATISSWKNAIAELDRKIREEVLSDSGSYAGGTEGRRRRELEKQQRIKSGKQETGEGDAHAVWSLPESRRTLEMVKESIEADRQQLEKRSEAAKFEAQACREGAALWEEVVERVEALESQLGKAIATVNRQTRPSRPRAASSKATVGLDKAENSSSLIDDGHHEPGIQQSGTKEERSEGQESSDDAGTLMQKFFADLDAGTDDVSAALAHATENGWSLLEVAIGAELEALHTARDLLGDALVDSKVWSTDDLAASQRTIRPPNVSVAQPLSGSSADLPTADAIPSASSSTAVGGNSKGKAPESYHDYSDEDDGHGHEPSGSPRKAGGSSNAKEDYGSTALAYAGSSGGTGDANTSTETSEPASPEMERIPSTASASRFSIPMHRRSLSQQLIQHEKEQDREEGQEQGGGGDEDDDAVHDGPDPQLLFGG